MAFAQPATFNEEWSDARVLSHLNHLPPVGFDADFNVLYTAYKYMRPSDFKRLLTAFVAENRNLHAKNPDGLTFVDVIGTHAKQNQAFIALIAEFS